MGYIDEIKWPGVLPYLIVWGVMSLGGWVLASLICLVFLYEFIRSGLVPAPVLLVLAVIPIACVTLFAQTALFLVGLVIWPGSPDTNKRLVFFGTLPLSFFCLCLIVALAGGLGAFVVRI